MKAFLTVDASARWEKFVGDAAVSSSASKKTPTFFEKLPTFFGNCATFLRVMPAVARKISLSLHVGKMCACS